MTSAGLVSLLKSRGVRVFTSADLITLTGLAPSAATQALRRLAAADILCRIKKGVWVNRLLSDFNSYEALAYLRAPWPAYVSLYSGLSDHGLVAEVPHTVFGVSAARPARFTTPVGTFWIHHLPARLMWGYEMKPSGRGVFPLADPEKAFLDTVYLALAPRSQIRFPQRRGPRWSLDRRRLKAYAKRFAFAPLLRWLNHESLV